MHILKMVVKFCTKLSFTVIVNTLCFQLGKARGRPIYSPDNLIKRTRKAAGITYSSVYRVVN
jgi:hypothetical protein